MTSTGEIASTLRKCPLFADSTDDEISLLAPLCKVEEFGHGDRIFSEGQPANKLYVVMSGKVALEMRVQFGPGKSQYLATVEVVEAGEPCGWSALVEPYVYTMSGVCLEPAKLTVVPATILWEVLLTCPMGLSVMRRLAILIASRARGARNSLLHALAILSHDMKAPLAAIESYNQVMLGEFAGPITDKQRELLQRNSVRVNETLALIRDLLDVSRIDAGNLSREFQDTSLGEIAADCMGIAQALGDAKGLVTQAEIPGDLPGIVAAPVRLRQVVTNLLSNAVKFTPPGGTVALRVSDLGDHQRLEVIDTGTGISPEDLPHVFDDFYTGQNVEGKGQGMGLPIARKIVTAHGGRIWAESPYPDSNDHGSCFTFVIPKDLPVYTAKHTQ